MILLPYYLACRLVTHRLYWEISLLVMHSPPVILILTESMLLKLLSIAVQVYTPPADDNVGRVNLTPPVMILCTTDSDPFLQVRIRESLFVKH